MKAGDVVEVWWDDHAFYSHYKGQDIAPSKSIGYLVENSERFLKLAQSYQGEKAADEVADVLVVDKRMLTKMRKVR